MMPAAWRQHLAEREGGMTLVEVLVSMMLLTIVIGLSTGSLINALDQQSNITQSTDAQTSNQNGMERFSRLLRQAVYPVGGTSNTSTIVTTATATKIVFTSRLSGTAGVSTTSIDAPVRQYSFELVGTDLKWGFGQENDPCVGVCTYATPVTSQTIVRGVRNAGGSSACPNNTSNDTSVFKYVYLDPNTGLETTATPPVTDPKILGELTYVKITLYTQTQTGPGRPACVPLTDYVQLRNKT